MNVCWLVVVVVDTVNWYKNSANTKAAATREARFDFASNWSLTIRRAHAREWSEVLLLFELELLFEFEEILLLLE